MQPLPLLPHNPLRREPSFIDILMQRSNQRTPDSRKIPDL